MSGSPTTENKTATDVNQVIHGLIYDVAVSSAEKELVAAFPWLALPVIDQLQKLVVNYIAGNIYDALARGATFTIIDEQASQEAKAANDAATLLKKAISVGDQNAITQASEAFKNDFGRLVHFDGSASL